MSEEKDYPTKGWSVESRLPLRILFGGKKPRLAVLDAFDLLNPKEQITVDLAVFYIVRDKRRAIYNPRLTTFERTFALNNAVCWITRHQHAMVRDLRHDVMFNFLSVRFPRWNMEPQAK